MKNSYEILETLRDQFELIDDDGSGVLDPPELVKAMRNLGVVRTKTRVKFAIIGILKFMRFLKSSSSSSSSFKNK